MAKINIVFEQREINRDAATIPEYVFVEVETLDGRSINAGEWGLNQDRRVSTLTIDLEALNKQLTPERPSTVTMQEIAEDYGSLGLSIPAKGEVWKHHSGRLYRIDGLRNTAHPSTKFPVRVLYTSLDDGNEYDRALSDWHASFGANAVPVEMPKPYFTYEDNFYEEDDPFTVAIRKRPVYVRDSKGAVNITMGFILCVVDDVANAKILTDTLNAAFPPNPNEPKD